MESLNINSTFTLTNGVQMPRLGLGVFQVEDGDEVKNSIKYAWEAGYKLIDTASFYGNEKGVGDAVREMGINRKDIFITTKVWNSDQGYDKTIAAFKKSLSNLKMEYLDLYLIHWPVKGKYKKTWKALVDLYRDGKIKAIGVSNFLQHQLEDLLEEIDVVPMVNQIEYHPYLTQPSLVKFCKDAGIAVQAWSPLMQGRIFEVKEIIEMASKYKVSAAQLVVRWDLQNGILTLPKSVKKERIISNANVFNFAIEEADMKILNKLDHNQRIGPDPDNFDF